MLAPSMVFLIIFSFIPMFGIVMAFQNYIPAKGISGSAWVGLDNFKFMFQIPDSRQILINTMVIAIWKIIVGTFVSIVFALLLNEIRVRFAKKFMQTVVYLPNFLSWAVLATVVMNIFRTKVRSTHYWDGLALIRFCLWPAIIGLDLCWC